MHKEGSWHEYKKTGIEPITFCNKSMWKTRHHAYKNTKYMVTCKKCLKEMNKLS